MSLATHGTLSASADGTEVNNALSVKSSEKATGAFVSDIEKGSNCVESYRSWEIGIMFMSSVCITGAGAGAGTEAGTEAGTDWGLVAHGIANDWLASSGVICDTSSSVNNFALGKDSGATNLCLLSITINISVFRIK